MNETKSPRADGFWTTPRPLGQRVIALACLVVPASALIAYILFGTGQLIAALIVSPLICGGLYLALRNVDTRG